MYGVPLFTFLWWCLHFESACSCQCRRADMIFRTASEPREVTSLGEGSLSFFWLPGIPNWYGRASYISCMMRFLGLFILTLCICRTRFKSDIMRINKHGFPDFIFFDDLDLGYTRTCKLTRRACERLSGNPGRSDLCFMMESSSAHAVSEVLSNRHRV